LISALPPSLPPSLGYFGPKDDPSKRLAWALMYYKAREEDNTYARPLDGLRLVVDLLKQYVFLCLYLVHVNIHLSGPSLLSLPLSLCLSVSLSLSLYLCLHLKLLVDLVQQ